jgi:polysaccharide export outer membrane protein
MKHLLRVLVASLLLFPMHLEAQVPMAFDPGRVELTRSDLERLLEQYEEALRSTAYSGRVMDLIRADAQRVRDRLSEGDFRVGDAVVLFVQGEPEIPDTVPVEPGPQVTLPLFGSIPLAGVLRSELETHLTEELSAFIRDPVVRAQALMRLSIQGVVGRPGFFVVPADMLVTEAIMMAGGPGQDANLDDLRIERAGESLIEGEDLQEALIQGRTLDQLNLRAGDQIYLPPPPSGRFWNIFLRYGIALTSFAIFGFRLIG